MLERQLKTNWCSKYMSFIAGIYQRPLPPLPQARRAGEQLLFPCGVRFATGASRSPVNIQSTRATRLTSRVARTGSI